jgi:predicted nucleotidyltransferase
VSEFAPERIFAALQASGVGYVTVGGFAAIAHGVVRATVDVDLIADGEPANLERLAAALASLSASPDGEPKTPVTPSLLARDANMRFQSIAGQIDLLGAEQYRRLYPELRSRAIQVDVDGLAVVVASRNDLIRLKAGTGRDRDLLDIGDLLALDE